ncbi:hypothetical protein [Sphingomonas sp. PWP1-2]|uniref:hypothetical protein n=1 Tax=Sphingomonas sp. PWP1-2 TaxID=2804558 RepID=UPI003CED7AB9
MRRRIDALEQRFGGSRGPSLPDQRPQNLPRRSILPRAHFVHDRKCRGENRRFRRSASVGPGGVAVLVAEQNVAHRLRDHRLDARDAQIERVDAMLGQKRCEPFGLFCGDAEIEFADDFCGGQLIDHPNAFFCHFSLSG